MGFGDLFKASENAELRTQIIVLQEENTQLKALLMPEHKKLRSVSEEIESKKIELRELIDQIQRESDSLQQRIDALKKEISDNESNLSQLKSQIIETDETVLLQSFGLYKPKYDFANSTQYKDHLANIRKKQKDLIKSGGATLGINQWTINGSVTQGRKMVKDMQKLLLRAFNSECDELVRNVKFNNIESYVKRMTASKDAISKLGSIMQLSISPLYFDLKLQELHLAHEYALKKQEEKEELKLVRAEQREQAKLQKEIEVARKNLIKEQTHCENALAKMLKQDTSSFTQDEKAAYDAKKSELESQLKEIRKGIADVDYRAANQKAGYVYIISNIGSFGENIYKIGMTRRLDPMDRVDELGDASVPFKFDVHALIFSEDAPALEAALHKAFEDRKVNMVNTRREFFNVTLDEIKDVVTANFDKTVEFTEAAPAEQYRESLLMKKVAVTK